jgi:poly-gamma-glutamate synthesis protein (capsule biosynthesis protein)
MIGRGVDQVLRRPSQPTLYESAVTSAAEYVTLAEERHGPIPRGVDDAYVWGTALEELERRRPTVRIINLETSVTVSDTALPKGINYRMHPANIGVLTAAGIDCAVLANNHTLDWGEAGLGQTIDTLRSAGIRTVGAGRTRSEADEPAALALDAEHRLLLFALCGMDSGVPAEWRATRTRPGVSWIADYSAQAASRVSDLVALHRRPGDVVVVSMHWGSNWSYEIPAEHRAFAHRLVDDAAVDIVYGHSSHHVKGVEFYRDCLILYGCGDFLNDYEGIHSPGGYRHDLVLMYLPQIDLGSGSVMDLEVVPLLIHRFRLQRPAPDDARWLRETFDRECRRLGARLVSRNGALHVERISPASAER